MANNTCAQPPELYQGDGSTTKYSFAFPYIKSADIVVFLWNDTTKEFDRCTLVDANACTGSPTEYYFDNSTPVELTFCVAPGLPPADRFTDFSNVIIGRETDICQMIAYFYPGTSIRAQDLNNDFTQILLAIQDIQSGFYKTLEEYNGFVRRSGDTMAGPLDMDDNKLTGVPYPSVDSDATNKYYVDSNFVHITGGTMQGPLDMGGNRLTGVPDPLLDSDAVNLSYIDQFINGDTGTARTTRHREVGTTGQTIVNVFPAFAPGNELVFINGVELSRYEEYTTPSNTQVVFNEPLHNGDVIDVISYNNLLIVDGTTNFDEPAFARNSFVATAGQTAFTCNDEFTIAKEQVFMNGALLVRGVDYLTPTSARVVLTMPALEGDIVEVQCDNYLAVSQVDDLYTYPGGVTQTVQKRLEQYVSVKDFGAKGDGVTDNTAAYNSIVSSVPEGSIIYWPPGTYVGKFESTKAFELIGGSKVVLKWPNGYAITFLGQISDPSPLTTPAFGDTTLVGVTGLGVNDIIRIDSGNTRPNDSRPVNFELLKMLGADEVEDCVRSTQTGSTSVYRKLSTVDGPSVSGFTIDDSGTEGGGILFKYCQNVRAENITMYGGKSSTIFADNVYNVVVNDSYRLEPSTTTSGQGYHIQFDVCRLVTASGIHGSKCRHVLDNESVYRFTGRNIFCTNSLSSDVVITHNGFGGSHLYDNVSASETLTMCLSTSAQGFDAANLSNQVLNNVTITNVRVHNSDITTRGSLAPIYFQYPVNDVTVSNVSITADNSSTDKIRPGVRIDGAPKGRLTLNNISVKNYEIGIYFQTPNIDPFGTGTGDPINITDFSFDNVKNPIIDYYFTSSEAVLNIVNPTCSRASSLYMDVFLETEFAHGGYTTLDLKQTLVSTNLEGIHQYPAGYVAYARVNDNGKLSSSLTGTTLSQYGWSVIGQVGRYSDGQTISSIGKPIGEGSSFVLYGTGAATSITAANVAGAPLTLNAGEKLEFKARLDQWLAFRSSYST